MTQSATDKTTIIRKLRRFSIVISIFYLFLAVLHLLSGAELLSGSNFPADEGARSWITGMIISYALLMIISVLAALLFFRISKEGKPFRENHVKMVRIIGVMCFILGAAPVLTGFLHAVPSVTASAGAAPSGASLMMETMMQIDLTPILEGFLMLFIAQILHYGSMLQLESDETL